MKMFSAKGNELCFNGQVVYTAYAPIIAEKSHFLKDCALLFLDTDALRPQQQWVWLHSDGTTKNLSETETKELYKNNTVVPPQKGWQLSAIPPTPLPWVKRSLLYFNVIMISQSGEILWTLAGGPHVWVENRDGVWTCWTGEYMITFDIVTGKELTSVLIK
jgi:hypothetical protein